MYPELNQLILIVFFRPFGIEELPSWFPSIPSYFTALITGFALATWLGARWAKRSRLDHEVIIDLGLFSLIAGVVGSRLLHVFADGFFWDYVHLCTDPSLVEWRITAEQCAQYEGVWDSGASVCRPAEADCFAWAAFWNGGLTYYGGLIGAAAYGLWFLRRESFPMWKAADMAGMTIPIGLCFGRIGCFLGGCCFGHTVEPDFELAVSFPPWSDASLAQWRAADLAAPSLASLPVHPAQLYESIGALAIAAVTMFVVHPRKRFDGMVFLTFLGLYAVLRFALETFRADDRGGVGPLSTSQLVGLAILAVVAFAWGRLSRQARARLAPATPAPGVG